MLIRRSPERATCSSRCVKTEGEQEKGGKKRLHYDTETHYFSALLQRCEEFSMNTERAAVSRTVRGREVRSPRGREDVKS